MLLQISLVFVLFYVGFTLYQKWGRPDDFPPGPPIFPIIGSILSLGVRPALKLKSWKEKYGDIIGLKIGPLNAVVLNNIDLIKEAFNQNAFSGTITTELHQNIFGGKNVGIGFSEGRHWSEQRRFAVKTLKNFGFGKSSIETLALEDVNEFIETIRNQCGKPLRPGNLTNVPILNSLWCIVTGRRFEMNDPILKEILHKFKTFEKSAGIGSLSLVIPKFGEAFPEWSAVKKFEDACDAAKSLICKIIDEHKATFQEDNLRDYIDANLCEIYSTTDASSSFYKETGETNLVAVCMNLFLAGSSSTSLQIGWAIHYLMENPRVQLKLQKEIETIVGRSRLPCLADWPDMPYAQAVMLEVSRMASSVPLGGPHKTMEDVVFHGYKIPKGTVVFANLYAHHYDEGVWGDPKMFRPERFLKENDDNEKIEIMKGHPSVISFSVGKRSCPAETMATNTIFLLLTGILQQFFVTKDPNSKVGKEPLGIVYTPPDTTVILMERLHST